MAIRVNIAIASLAGLMVACATQPDNTGIMLRSQRRNVSVKVMPPVGWRGPGYQAFPSYDSFSFSHGEESAASYLEVRFDPYTNEVADRHSDEDIAIHWSTTPLTEIRRQLGRDFKNPQVELLDTISVAGAPTLVHAVYNADGDSYIAEIVRSGTVIFIDLRCGSRDELERHRSMFIAFLKSLVITA